MSVNDFVKDVLKENREEIDEIKRLQEILDQFSRRRTRIYTISVTSNV